jgi:hypothetical protein
MSQEFEEIGYQIYHSLINPLTKETEVITESDGKIKSWMSVDERGFVSFVNPST